MVLRGEAQKPYYNIYKVEYGAYDESELDNLLWLESTIVPSPS